jgi:Mrp family chromosome partitioning ATPase
MKKALVTNVAFGLDLLPAGEARGKAAELCEGRTLTELVQSLCGSYECVVVDAPPVLETSEARVLAALSDVVVLVLRLDESSVPSLKRAAGILRGVGARLLGCIPNAAASRSGARAFAGGISVGGGPASGSRATPAAGEGSPSEGADPRARGTDFLGLEERAGHR